MPAELRDKQETHTKSVRCNLGLSQDSPVWVSDRACVQARGFARMGNLVT